MIMHNVKGVACNDEPTENYHLTLCFPFLLWSYECIILFSEPTNVPFGFTLAALTNLFSVFQWESFENTVCLAMQGTGCQLTLARIDHCSLRSIQFRFTDVSPILRFTASPPVTLTLAVNKTLSCNQHGLVQHQANENITVTLQWEFPVYCVKRPTGVLDFADSRVWSGIGPHVRLQSKNRTASGRWKLHIASLIYAAFQSLAWLTGTPNENCNT